MRYVGIDLGDRRTGVALGDSVTRTSSPLCILEVPLADEGGRALLSRIEKVVREHVGSAKYGIVLGLPLNMDDSEGPRAKSTRIFGERLAALLGTSVHLQDERLTSSEADWAMAQSGLTHKQKKARRDAIAAAAILRDFLEALPRET